MTAVNKATFIQLCTRLRDVEADLSNLKAVKELNLALLTEILHDEAQVKTQRDSLKALKRSLKHSRSSKSEAKAIREEIETCERTIEEALFQLFIWRCIGDGLAYAYIDTLNIRQVFFDTTGYIGKAGSGFISGKLGLEDECALLLRAIEQKVPAVLCDLTNVIRYGDVCLLGGSDPFPLEVKSRPDRSNQRGKRQAAKLAELQNYLDQDFALNFRGSPLVHRKANDVPNPRHLADLNLSIQSARTEGWNAVCPERGLVYIAINGSTGVSEILRHLEMEKPMLCILNNDKTGMNWAPYLPFVNSIRDINALYDFVVGDLTLIVVVDAAVVCERLSMPGFRVSAIEHPNHGVLFEQLDNQFTFMLSTHMFGQLFYEFLSLGGFADNTKQSVQQMMSGLDSGIGVEVDVTELANLVENVTRFHEQDA